MLPAAMQDTAAAGVAAVEAIAGGAATMAWWRSSHA